MNPTQKLNPASTQQFSLMSIEDGAQKDPAASHPFSSELLIKNLSNLTLNPDKQFLSSPLEDPLQQQDGEKIRGEKRNKFLNHRRTVRTMLSQRKEVIERMAKMKYPYPNRSYLVKRELTSPPYQRMLDRMREAILRYTCFFNLHYGWDSSENARMDIN
ncbi:developmental pluripotency-associated protein 3-like [Tamandua tetradactyla]|uniref:developmental pluripotency-associated protein 3-like n=1 Tax=Tamandua tetradactyla TaxID=48850 RepID=UPI00405467C6